MAVQVNRCGEEPGAWRFPPAPGADSGCPAGRSVQVPKLLLGMVTVPPLAGPVGGQEVHGWHLAHGKHLMMKWWLLNGVVEGEPV